MLKEGFKKMIANEDVIDDKSNDKKKEKNEESSVRFRGKDVKIEKLQKKVRHKPKLFGVILINFSIIIAVLIVILILLG